MMFFLAALSIGSLMTPLRSGNNTYVVSGETLFGSGAVPVDSYILFDCETPAQIPEYVVQKSETTTIGADGEIQDYVYVYHQRRLAPISGLISHTSSVLVVPACDLPELSVLTDFHNKTMVFIGPPSAGVLAHLDTFSGIPLSSGSTLPRLGVTLSGGGGDVAVNLSLDAWDHEITSGTMCGRWTIGGAEVTIGCTAAQAALSGVPGDSVLSVRALGIGIGVGDGTLTVYKTSEDRNTPTNHFTLVVLFAFLLTWVYFFHVPETSRILENTDVFWKRVSEAWLVLICDVVILCMSMTAWAAVRQQHNMYNMATIDMIGLEGTNTYIRVYSYGVIPSLSGTALAALMYGNHVHGDDAVLGGKWFTWQLPFLDHARFRSRLFVFLFVLAIFTAIVVTFWLFLFSSWPSALISAIGVIVTAVYVSSSSEINQLLASPFDAFRDADGKVLLYLRWSVEVLVLVTMAVNTPYNIGGSLASTFHDGMQIGIAFVLCIISGRDTSYLLLPPVPVSIVVATVAVNAFVISFCTLFGMSVVFGLSGALENRPTVALHCSAVFSYFWFVIAYRVTRSYGVLNRVD